MAIPVALGDTLRLVAEAFDENGHPVEGAVFTWSSSDASVATVAGSGLVRGIRAGAATITATAGDTEGTAEITVEDPDRATLVALYNATDGPNWVNNEGWLTDAPLEAWYGVDTDATGLRALGLGGNNLSGSIPPQLMHVNLNDEIAISHKGQRDTESQPAALGARGHLDSLRRLAAGAQPTTPVGL